MRRAVAENPNTPVNTLEQLSRDRDSIVVSCVARNPSTPAELLSDMYYEWSTNPSGISVFILNDISENPNFRGA